MNPVYLKDWIKKIPVEKRILVSDVIFGFLILSVYLGIFGIIFSALFKSTTFFPFLYILIPLFLFLYIMFSPNLFERIIYDIKELSKNLNNGEEKRIFYHQLSRDLNKITRRKGEGYSKKFYTIFKDYFSNVMVYLIFSKRENSRKIIKEFLVKLSVSKDIYDLHDGFMEMNQKVIQLREFKNLLIAFPPLNKKELQNPFLWIPKISDERKIKEIRGLRKVYNYLDDNGIIKLALHVLVIIVIATLSGLILDYFGLLSWAKSLIELIP